jgi:hypothetical protein
MRKPDDDLKIDLSELFDGVVPSAPSDELSPGDDDRFQEWVEGRDKKMELQALELEKRLREVNNPKIMESASPSLEIPPEPPAARAAQPPPPPPPLEEAPPPPPEPVLPAEVPAEEPRAEVLPAEPAPMVDFDAPIRPPFMGRPLSEPVPPAEPASEGVPADQASEAELREIQAAHEFLLLYDELRNIIAYELKELAGERKTFTMLARTVELAREKHPEILRNANWDEAGNLLADGSLDSQRILDNKAALDPRKADEVVDSALAALLRLRLQAVEKGLGAGLKNKIRARLYQWVSEKTQKAAAEGRDQRYLKRLNGYVAAT